MSKKYQMWYTLPGNPYMVNISPLMLLPGGYLLERSLKKKGEEEATITPVCYDRQFVIQSIISTVISPLTDLDDAFIADLFSEALEFYRWLDTQDLPGFTTSKNKSFYLWEQFHTYKDALKDLGQ
jgi:hypothetical protein